MVVVGPTQQAFKQVLPLSVFGCCLILLCFNNFLNTDTVIIIIIVQNDVKLQHFIGKYNISLREDPQTSSTNQRDNTLNTTYKNQMGVNLTSYLFTGNRTTLHLPDVPHLLLHLLLLHQNIKVALLQLVLLLR